jgi:hypothetical protein
MEALEKNFSKLKGKGNEYRSAVSQLAAALVFLTETISEKERLTEEDRKFLAKVEKIAGNSDLGLGGSCSSLVAFYKNQINFYQ